MKLIPSLAVAGSLLLTVVMPAFAFSHGAVLKNSATIISAAGAYSNTGANTISTGNNYFHHSMGSSNTILTGMAGASAGSAVSGVNLTDSYLFGLKKINNTANINSSATASSSTGGNSITTGANSTNLIGTGDASSDATSMVSNVNVTGFGLSM